MLPAVLNVETVPLGVGYGVRFEIRLLGGGVVVIVFAALLAPHPNSAPAKQAEKAETSKKTRTARCRSIVRRPPRCVIRGNTRSRRAVENKKVC
jgi:hypothetical protein